MEAALPSRTPLERILIRARRNPPAIIVFVFSLLLAVAIAIKAGPAQLLNVVVTGGMWALLAAGLALIFGVMNIPHFAHGESFMVGAYIGYGVFTALTSYLQAHPSRLLSVLAPNVGVIAALIVGAILGVVIEKLAISPLRKRTRFGWVMNTFLLTVGLSFILTNGVMLLPFIGPNYRGIPRYYDVPSLNILGVNVAVDRIWAFAISLISIAALTLFLQRTRTGRAIRAVSQDETGAELVGINLGSIHTLTFSLATAMAAMAGAAMLFMFQAYPTVGLRPLYLSWYVVMLVGLGNVYGAIVGGFIVALLEAGTQQFVGIAWADVIPTAVMILVLLLVPSGIFGSEVKGVQEQ
jgi:branched-chain amino acid transport system permease protein